MSIEKNYRLLEVASDLSQDRDQELLAREIASGRPVVIHLLGGGRAAENDALLRTALTLPLESSSYVIDTGVFRNVPYVVTHVLPGNSSLRSWLAVITQDPQSKVNPRTQPPQTSEAEQGDFTKRLRPLTGTQTAPGVPPVTQSSSREPGEFTKLVGGQASPLRIEADGVVNKGLPMLEQPAQASPPGEFTRLFRGSLGPPPERDIVTAPASPFPSGVGSSAPDRSLDAVRTDEPSEFSRLFRPLDRVATPDNKPPAVAPAQPQESGSSPRPHISSSPQSQGEFTRMFGGPAGPSAPNSEKVTSEKSRDMAPAHEPGEFTRMLDTPFESPRSGVPESPASPQFTPPPPAVRAPGEFTRIFGSDAKAGSLPEPPALPDNGATGAFSVRSQPPVTPAQQGPSEYTRMFSAPIPASPPVVKAEPPKPSAVEVHVAMPAVPAAVPPSVHMPSVAAPVASVSAKPAALNYTPPKPPSLPGVNVSVKGPGAKAEIGKNPYLPLIVILVVLFLLAVAIVVIVAVR